jgi:deazaflavin-dependent oxidoreductase (nitroreductase family)
MLPNRRHRRNVRDPPAEGPLRDRTVKHLSRLHALAYRVSGGRLGGRLVDNDMLLLTTTGRRTGSSHTVPLLYLRDDDALIVIASYGGRPEHPEWYRNLAVSPTAVAQVGSTRMSVVATTLDEEDRALWWPRIVEAYRDYAVYQSRTEREIPVVRLTPG